MQSPKTRLSRYWGITALVLATAVLYAPSAQFDFVPFDDPTYVSENELVRGGLTPSGCVTAFTTLQASNWHPLTWLSHMLDVSLFGLKPGPMHLVNLGWHLGSVVLLYAAMSRLTNDAGRSLFVTALFAVHPTRAESVAWISERKDVLCVFFGFLALWCYAGYGQALRTGRRAVGWYLATLAAFSLSLLSKQMLVTLPCVFWLCDVWPLRRLAGDTATTETDSRRVRFSRIVGVVLDKLPLFALVAIAMGLCLLAQRNAMQAGITMPPGTRVLNAMSAYAAYVGNFFWPLDLQFYYAYPAWRWSTGWVVLDGILLLAITLFALVRGGKSPAVLIGWCWFLGTLVPVIGLVQVGSQAMADRYTYVPYVGLAMMLAWGLPERWTQAAPGAMRGLAVACVIGCLAVSVGAVQAWRSGRTLGEQALRSDPYNSRAHDLVGLGYYQAGEFSQAREHFERAVTITPDLWPARNNLALASLREGNPAKAIPHWVRVLAEAPRSHRAHRRAGLNAIRACLTVGDRAQAQTLLDQMVAWYATDSELWRLYLEFGRAHLPVSELRELAERAANACSDDFRVLRDIVEWELSRLGEASQDVARLERHLDHALGKAALEDRGTLLDWERRLKQAGHDAMARRVNQSLRQR